MGFASSPGLDQALRKRLNNLVVPMSAFELRHVALEAGLAAAEAILASHGVAFTYTRAEINALLLGKVSPSEVTTLTAGKADKATTITSQGLLSGGGDLSANRTLNVPKASGTEVIAGADDVKAATALAVRAGIFHWVAGLRNIQIFKSTGVYIPTVNTRNIIMFLQDALISQGGDNAPVGKPQVASIFFLSIDPTAQLQWVAYVGQESVATVDYGTPAQKTAAATKLGVFYAQDTANAPVSYANGCSLMSFNGTGGSIMVWEF
jgi:hypothetical protein